MHRFIASYWYIVSEHNVIMNYPVSPISSLKKVAHVKELSAIYILIEYEETTQILTVDGKTIVSTGSQ